MALEAAAAPLASAACNKAVAEGTAFHSLALQLPMAGCALSLQLGKQAASIHLLPGASSAIFSPEVPPGN